MNSISRRSATFSLGLERDKEDFGPILESSKGFGYGWIGLDWIGLEWSGVEWSGVEVHESTGSAIRNFDRSFTACEHKGS